MQTKFTFDLFLCILSFSLCLLAGISMVGYNFLRQRNMIYLASLHIILFSFLLFLVADKIQENIIANLYESTLYLEWANVGLDPSSNKEMIAHGEIPKYSPMREDRPTDEAIVIVHGAAGGPREMRRMHEYYKKKGDMDIYLPILKYHRRSLKTMSKVNYMEMIGQFKKDIEYVSSRHQKVYLILHSLSSDLGVYLSLKGALPENVYLLLYAPAISNNISWFMRSVCEYTQYINKYVIVPPDYSIIMSGQRFFIIHYVVPRNMAILLYDASIEITKMIKNGGKLHNKFAVLLLKGDSKIPYKEVQQLISNDSNAIECKVLDGLGHAPHHFPVTDDQFGDFMLSVDELIEKLRAVE